MSKKDLTEEDIKLRYITPAINNAGWKNEHIRMEYYFTDGRVIFQGKVHARQTGKKADYLLFHAANKPIAIVEAKDNNKPLGGGMQQAMEYAHILDIPFAYSSNGDGFLEHDFLTGKETELSLKQFPTPENLYKRLIDAKQLRGEALKIVEQPFYSDPYTYDPRYYQRIAVERTVEAIAKGKDRVLIVMATGTGKTITAFQIIHRLKASGLKKKILYLADRNILIDQTMVQDFKPFKKVMTKVQGATIDSAYEVYMALYHQLVSNEEGVEDPFKQVQPTFFDLIIVDECHRGSAKDDSAWRKVLEYFNSATQIGMTATPKAETGANNLDYFGEPIFTYSLLQGIQDGFLAPYRVTNSYISIDLQGFKPDDDEKDLLGREIAQRLYERKDIGRDIAFTKRREIVAKRITKMLKQIGRMTKTIVFCTDIEEAEAMRSLLVNLNADLCKKDARYIMRITGDDNVGKKQLDNFIDVDQPYPTVVTTSELLATGVDCKTCGLIVIDKEIGSMTEFKQIIGRGTRLRTDKGKWHLEILDFRNATAKFKDPKFDGDPEPPQGKSGKPYTMPEEPSSVVSEPHVKYLVEGEKIAITTEIVSILGEDGKTMRTESITDFTRKQIRKRYATLNDFVKNWTEAERKKAIVDELKDYSVLVDAVREKNPALANADIFDVICHVAFDQPPVSRRERANNVKKRNYFAKYEGKAREVLEALLDKYADYGILNLEDSDILDTAPFNKIGKPQKIVKLFGGLDKFEQALKELENEIYKVA
ncbi:EcoAI/FtnUII family type I restriction enzme subunit R [uncultured Prevotella sp.]|uniref:EcoAI/FtnUII family type I restriction enzme subunit R n=1 Tax=uncultured Prevotella sp. TaxID=159272 RepID=UPI0027DC9C81|nr:DEAD/DEAH box helicase family protein [uncultured Prevotella sp.]